MNDAPPSPRRPGGDTYFFSAEEACKYKVTGAVLMANFRFWLRKFRYNDHNIYDGYYWVYNSRNAFSKQLPFLHRSSITRSIEKLKKAGAVITGNYNKAGFDRTLWYTIPEEYSVDALPQRDPGDVRMFLGEDAEKWGVDKAVLLYNLKCWLNYNQDNGLEEHDGYTWVKKSAADMADYFPFYSGDSIKKHLYRMEQEGVLKAAPNPDPWDNTKLWTIPALYSLPGGESLDRSNRATRGVISKYTPGQIEPPIPDTATPYKAFIAEHPSPSSGGVGGSARNILYELCKEREKFEPVLIHSDIPDVEQEHTPLYFLVEFWNEYKKRGTIIYPEELLEYIIQNPSQQEVEEVIYYYRNWEPPNNRVFDKRRRSLQTVLANWQGEVAKAREWNPPKLPL